MGNTSLVAPKIIQEGDGQSNRIWKTDGCEQQQDTPVRVGGVGDMEIPRGAIMIWYSSEDTIPQGWVPCDGREIVYVDENDETIFRYTVPDMRGRMAANLDEEGQKSGEKIGKEFITLPDHTHTNSYTPRFGNNYGNDNIVNNSSRHIGGVIGSTTRTNTTSKSNTSESSRTYNQIPSCAVLFYIFRAY